MSDPSSTNDPSSASADTSSGDESGPKASIETPDAPDETSPSDQAEEAPMPIVGIGASAGGVEALQDFFAEIPAETPIAFVVVMHLPGDRSSGLVEVLQQSTALPVERATDGTPVAGGRVYVIPSGHRLEISEGALHLAETEAPHEATTIDRFLRSLAADQAANSVGIVLSGMGTDGTLGLRAIKEAGGVAFVQSPEDAAQPHMPQSAIATGLIDLVAPPAELAERLLAYRDSAGVVQLPDQPEALDGKGRSAMQKIFARLQDDAGHDFSGYKRSTILRRLERRMQIHSTKTLEAYLRHLREDGSEIQALKKDLLITVTNFFRDPEAFEHLKSTVIPDLYDGKDSTDQVRVWVPGCATGEEAYSLAMLLLEEAEQRTSPPKCQVFATDVDEDVLSDGREGLYPETIRADVSDERLARFFRPEDTYYRVAPHLRDTVLFAKHDLITDPPFSRLDLVSCRNLLIYLRPEMQEEALRRIHYGLREGGFLVLGRSETVGRQTDLFSPEAPQHNVLRARALPEEQRPRITVSLTPGSDGERPTGLEERSAPPSTDPGDPSTAEELHRRTLLQTVSSILVDRDFQIAHLSGEADRYLVFEEGTPTLGLLPLVPEGLRPPLQTALYQAFENGARSHYEHLPVTLNGEERLVDFWVDPIEEPPRHAQVRFSDREADRSVRSDENGDPPPDKVKEELEQTREQLRTKTEEYEAATEEMEAANEELLSMNEELQAKNDQLKTAKEELQSVNEELKTTNQELETKIEALREANNDLENLMAATNIATLFLDRDLRINRFTPQVADLFNIRPADAGRPLSDFTRRFEHENLLDDARDVLRTHEPIEREVQQGEDTWFLMRLRPYRTAQDTVEGVVVTFVDISNRRQLEQELIDATERVRRRIGQDLHDDLGSDLMGLSMLTESLHDRLTEENPEAAEQTAKIREIVREAAEKARSMSHQLTPVSLQEESLARALDHLCQQQREHFGPNYRFVGEVELDLSIQEEATVHLYRIAQEALTNARRHGEATEIEIDLHRDDDALVLTVRDNGVGMPDEYQKVFRGVDPGNGAGLWSMRHRAHLIGGSLRAVSDGTWSTVLTCKVPLSRIRDDET